MARNLNAAPILIPAFAVFSGGGVKGVALAGAYGAAVAEGFDFKGFGGTSAGAIVACLASAGLSAKAMKDAMSVGQIAHPARIFRDDGGDLEMLGSGIGKLLKQLKTDRGPIHNYIGLGHGMVSLKKEEKAALAKLFGSFGVLDGSRLAEVLATLVAGSLKITPAEAAALTFADWKRRTGKVLRVVASNVTAASGLVFSEETTGDVAVIDAVVASAAFPFAFQPRPLEREGHPDAVLLDGGLASNTPAFLFGDLFDAARVPTIVFQLKGAAAPVGFPEDFRQLVQRVIETSVNAGDRIIDGLVSAHTHVIEIEGCDNIDTLEFLDQKQIRHLYNCGQAARSAVRGLAPWRRQHDQPPPGVTALGLRYGNPGPLLTSLIALRLQLYSMMTLQARAQGGVLAEKQSDLRVALFLPEDIDGQTWKVGFHVGFGRDKDVDIAFTLDRGCVGAAVRTRDIAIDDTGPRRPAPTRAGGPTKPQLRMVPAARHGVMAFPVLAYDPEGRARNDLEVVAVLTVDSTQSPEKAFWAPGGGGGVFAYVGDVLQAWSGVFARLLTS